MKNLSKKILFLLVISLPIISLAAKKPSGRKIAEMVKNGNKSRNRIVRATLSVIDNGKLIENRQILIKGFRKNNRDRTMSRFLNGLKRNVTFLSIEQGENEDNIQYLYVPGVGRPRQISSSEKQNDFEDTDLTNEDMGGRKINDYKYKRLKDRRIKIGSERFHCYVIISRHKNRDARFPKRKTWIDKKTLIPVRSKIYGKDGRLKRVFYAAKIREIKKGIYMPYFTYAKSIETNHETKMLVKKVTVDSRRLKFREFTPSNMSKPWRR